MRSRRRDQRGAILPSPVVMLEHHRGGDGRDRVRGDPRRRAHRARGHARRPGARSRRRRPRRRVKPKPPKPEIKRGEIYVEVYNNSNISGLAGQVAEKATGAGWKVVGSDNWVGTIPANTVYYPKRLKEEAELLALDLGIKRTYLAVAPMKLDRLDRHPHRRDRP